MRLFTKATSKNEVTYSYYVQFLKWLGEKLSDHAENIIHRHYR